MFLYAIAAIYSIFTSKELTDAGDFFKTAFGRISAAPRRKLRRAGGSVPPLCVVTAWPLAVATRPSNPLRTNRQHPKG
jgi:hypothetical protein